MTVQEFIDGYKKVVEKNGDSYKYIESRYNKDYVLHRDKIAICKKLAEVTSHKIVPDMNSDVRKYYSSDRINRYTLFMLNLVDLYTDIDIDFNSDDIMGQYELLDREDLIRIIVAGDYIDDDERRCGIPLVEYKRFEMIMDMAVAEIEDNENNIITYLDNKFESIGAVLEVLADSFVEKFGKIASDKIDSLSDEDKEAFANMFQQADKNGSLG